jgi:ankyrin repeat protein
MTTHTPSHLPPDDPLPAAIGAFKAAVDAGDAGRVEELVRLHPGLQVVLNEPWFTFDTPAVVHAASRQDRAMIDVLLDAGADVNATSTWWAGGFRAVHVADAAPGGLGEHLLKRGAAVDVHAAAHLGLPDRLRQIVEADGAAVHARGGDGQTPLHFAATPDIAGYLLDHGADIDARDVDHGSTPAQWAVKDRPAVCRYLVGRGARADIFMACVLGDAALADRCLCDDPACLRARIGRGQFVAGHSRAGHIYLYRLGYTARPLHLAAEMGHHAVVELLLDRSDPADRLLLACARADAAEVVAVLAGHPGLVQSLPPDDMRLISDAAWDGKAEAVRVMVEAGFDVDARGGDNGTPLDRAAVRGNLALVDLLLYHGAALDVRNDYGGTPLGACVWGSAHFRDAKGDYPACVERLIAAGSKVPQTAGGSPAVADVLRRHGAGGEGG